MRSHAEKRSVPILAGVVLLTGCAAGPPPAAPAALGPVPVERYFPLASNSRWSYRVQNLAAHLTYRSNVEVRGREFIDAIGREGVTVIERFVGFTGPGLVEEPEPILYYVREGFLERVYLTYQGGKAVPIGFGSEESRFLPAQLRPGERWDSDTVAFRVGDAFGYKVVHHHVLAFESEPVRVPAGSFRDCIRIDTHSSHGPGSGGAGNADLIFYYSDWYAPGIGLVRTQQWGDAEKRLERTRIELLEYEIGAEG